MSEPGTNHASNGAPAVGAELLIPPGSVSPRGPRQLLSSFLGGRGAVVIPLIGAALVLLYPAYGGNSFWMREIPVVTVYVLMVSGLNLSFGFAGELQFSQIAMFAFGGYVTAILALHGFNHIIYLLLLSGAAAAVLGIVIAVPAVRIGGWALAMSSFFLVLIVPDVIDVLGKWTGGYEGLAGVPLPTLAGHTIGPTGMYFVVVIVGLVWLGLFRNLATSRYAQIFRTMRESPELASSLGISVRATKILAFAIGAFPAGVAGCFLAYLNQSVSPSVFSVSAAIGIVAASVLGGVESVYGAVIGAAILQLGPLQTASFQQYSDLAFGIFLMLVAILLRRGLKGIGVSLVRRAALALGGGTIIRPAIAVPAALDIGKLDGQPLMVEHVVKRFGGVTALDDVSVRCEPGQVTGLIGANGSGKTTLLNVISGFVRCEGGSATLGGEVVSGKAPARVARQGSVARTFQTPIVPRGMSVVDAVATGSYGATKAGVISCALRLPRYWRARRADRATALQLLHLVGLLEFAEEEAASMPLGSRRLIEIARCVASRPALLLLDEPASGLSPEEVDRLGVIVRQIADAGATVVLIEHNFKFVLGVAQQIHVLELGILIASGSPEEIEHDPRVAESFLGRAVEVVEGTTGAGQ